MTETASRHPVRDRDWFQDAYIRIAALIAAGVMFNNTPAESVTVIEGQLQRAYERGMADQRKADRQ